MKLFKESQIYNVSKIENAEKLEDEGDSYKTGIRYFNLAEENRSNKNFEEANRFYEKAQKYLVETSDNHKDLLRALELAARSSEFIGDTSSTKILFCQAANIAEKRGMIKKAITLYRAAGKKDDVKRLS